MAGARVTVQVEDFDLGSEVAAMRAGDAGIGAVASFIGTVRDRNDGLGVSSMELEHYPGMTERAIESMIDEAMRRFEIRGARVIHRVGLLQPMDQIMMVAVSSAHRGEAFKACEFLMDYLKTQAPFWKKEQTPEGARGVDARSSDDAAIARWGITASNASDPVAPPVRKP
jgi:molybdopterin synthase catalytic subunit